MEWEMEELIGDGDENVGIGMGMDIIDREKEGG